MVFRVSIDHCPVKADISTPGIDKVQLWAPPTDFGIKRADSAHFGMNCTTRQGSGDLPILLTDSTGHQVRANSIYHNGKAGQYSINQKGLQVQFNPSKILHPYHLTGTGPDFAESIRAVGAELKAAGIRVNVDQMRLVRLDLAKQAEMANPFATYTESLRMLKGKRAKEQRQYPGGIVVGNSSWQTIGYDKGEELRSHHYTIKEKNLMRLETRLLKARAVKGLCGVGNLPELAQLSPVDLNRIYCGHLNSRYFPKQWEGEQSVFDFDTLVSSMQTASDHFGRGWLPRFLAVHQLDTLIQQAGGLDVIRKAMLEFLDRRRVSEYMRELQELITFKAIMDTRTERQTASSLLYEIQSRFAA